MSAYDAMTIDEMFAERDSGEHRKYRWRQINKEIGKRSAACTAIIRLSEALAEEGWVLVPEEPTDDMDFWGGQSIDIQLYPRDAARAVWKAMLNESPSLDSAERDDG